MSAFFIMKAALLKKIKTPLVIEEVPTPYYLDDEILIEVEACGLCRTDLHIIDGDLKAPQLPLILGHEIVGRIVEKGKKVTRFEVGSRVGVPWLAKSCNKCIYCKEGKENLCDDPLFTGYQKDGGFAEYTVAHSDHVFPLPENVSAVKLAPLLCAGLIGWRALKKCKEAKKIGFFGFGVSAHLLIQIAIQIGKEVYVFTRPSDIVGARFAKEMGARWAKGSDESPDELLDAAIIFAPVGALIPKALSVVRKGGIVVTAGIHMSDIPSFPYRLLWGEREVKSVANLTRVDGEEFFTFISEMPLEVRTKTFSLEDINVAIKEHREGIIEGAAVIEMCCVNGSKEIH